MGVQAKDTRWSITMVQRYAHHWVTGIGWLACLTTIKRLRVFANEDHGDVLYVMWTGDERHSWTWHATNDSPAILPAPKGLDNPPPA